LVTIDVGPLTSREIDDALSAGCAEAERLLRLGAIEAAALHLRGKTRLRHGAAETESCERVPSARHCEASEALSLSSANWRLLGPARRDDSREGTAPHAQS
jgi:hypothetical protein